MIDVTEGGVDLIAVVLALGLSAYALSLRQIFRGGIMDAPFKILTVAPLLFSVGEAVDSLNSFGLVTDPDGIIHISLEILFIIALIAGFYRLSKVWRGLSKEPVSGT